MREHACAGLAGRMQAIRLGQRGTNGVKRRSIDREDCNWHLSSSETLEPLHAHKGCSYQQFHAEGGSSSMPNSCDPNQNHLLAALSAAERDRIFPNLQLVSMTLGEVLSDPGNIQRYVYFPTDCIISFSYLMRDGASTEVALAGNEGLVGLALLTGARKSRAGRSCRVPATPTGWTESGSEWSSTEAVDYKPCFCATRMQ